MAKQYILEQGDLGCSLVQKEEIHIVLEAMELKGGITLSPLIIGRERHGDVKERNQ